MLRLRELFLRTKADEVVFHLFVGTGYRRFDNLDGVEVSKVLFELVFGNFKC